LLAAAARIMFINTGLKKQMKRISALHHVSVSTIPDRIKKEIKNERKSNLLKRERGWERDKKKKRKQRTGEKETKRKRKTKIGKTKKQKEKKHGMGKIGYE